MKDLTEKISEICKSIGMRSLECRGYSGTDIQNIALVDVFNLSTLLREALTLEIQNRPNINLK